MIKRCSKVDDGMIEELVDGETMIFDELNNKIHLLNKIATHIWNKISVDTPVFELEESILTLCNIESECDKQMVKKDIQEILENLKEEHLIKVCEVE